MLIERKKEYIVLPKRDALLFLSDPTPSIFEVIIPQAVHDYIIRLIIPQIERYAQEGWSLDGDELYPLEPDIKRLIRPFTSKAKFRCKGVTVHLIREVQTNEKTPTSILNEKKALPMHQKLEVTTDERPAQANSSNFVLIDTLRGHSQPVHSVAFTPNEQFLASSGGGEVKLWNLHRGRLERTILEKFIGEIHIAINSDGVILASANTSDSTIQLWNLHTGRLAQELHMKDGKNPSLLCIPAFSPDGNLVAGHNNEVTKLWKTYSGDLVYPPREKNPKSGVIHSIVFSPDGNILASGLKSGIELWDWKRNEISTLESDQVNFSRHGIPSMAFSPDGRLLATGNYEDTFYLWNLSTHKLFRTITGHSTWVTAVAISPDGQLLASGSGDGTIKLWQLPDVQLLGTLKGHTDGIHCVAFSSNGRLLASGSHDKTINIWKRN